MSSPTLHEEQKLHSGHLIVITGPSGVGKSTIVQEVLRRTNARYSVSVTTREPRPGEIDGKDYHFIDKQRFEKMIQRGELLEWAEVFGNYYGTPAKPVYEALKAGETIILEIDIQGGLQVHEKIPNATFILILPPSWDELLNRLIKRSTEPPEAIKRRFAKAREEIELAQKSKVYDYTVINDKLENAIEDVIKIINAVSEKANKDKRSINDNDRGIEK